MITQPRPEPAWNEATLEHLETKYCLQLENDCDVDEEINVTRHEYITLKRHLAEMRGVPAPPYDEEE